MKKVIVYFLCAAVLPCMTIIKSESINYPDSNLTTPLPTYKGNTTHQFRQKRQETEPYFPDYPLPFDYYDYPDPNPGLNPGPNPGPNSVLPLGIAGAGLALKAAKTKAKLKGLKFLAVPAGIALLGGIAALASGVIPPAVIGGINLPFQGKRRKRQINEHFKFKVPSQFKRRFMRKPQLIFRRHF